MDKNWERVDKMVKLEKLGLKNVKNRSLGTEGLTIYVLRLFPIF